MRLKTITSSNVKFQSAKHADMFSFNLAMYLCFPRNYPSCVYWFSTIQYIALAQQEYLPSCCFFMLMMLACHTENSSDEDAEKAGECLELFASTHLADMVKHCERCLDASNKEPEILVCVESASERTNSIGFVKFSDVKSDHFNYVVIIRLSKYKVITIDCPNLDTSMPEVFVVQLIMNFYKKCLETIDLLPEQPIGDFRYSRTMRYQYRSRSGIMQIKVHPTPREKNFVHFCMRSICKWLNMSYFSPIGLMQVKTSGTLVMPLRRSECMLATLADIPVLKEDSIPSGMDDNWLDIDLEAP